MRMGERGRVEGGRKATGREKYVIEEGGEEGRNE